ncbi:mitochondrial ribonuclease P catalytic subunit-like [Vespa mandarinia]|uniref:mitochondrial ribonuclease P catalytic subunit-like n=1 Tax=Vespa mandarinia TaxID=7446 RepID=UPI0016071B15|nr:mitochondrial ribonuclease P catalytic subunit-like [Vespa mandarinia]
MEFINKQIRFLFSRRNLLNKQIINKIQRISTQLKSNEIKETLFPLLDANYPSQDLCFNIRNDIINKHSVPEHTVDIQIFEIFMIEKKFETAKVYFKYLKSKNYPLSNFVLIKYLQLLSADQKPLSNFEEEEVLHICDVIKKKYECIPSSILFICVHVLCLTSKWETVFDLIKFSSENINSKTMSYIAVAAFRNGKPNIGFEFISEIESNTQDMFGRQYIYDQYLNHYIEHKDKLNNAIEKMFHFWRKHDIIPKQSIVNNFVDTCQKSGWEAHYTKIILDGKCSHCNNHLAPMVLGDSFHKLFKSVLSEIVIGHDIFQKTTPSEFNKFKQFIDKTKPFDIVVDSLNMTYGIYRNSSLQYMMSKFIKENKKILVIARKHQYNSIKWMFNLDNVLVYFFQNITDDDSYILYATLVSGNKAKFISLDLQRQHYHKLKDVDIQKIFIRWQFTHQYTWSRVNSKKHILIDPISYNPFAQVINGHWHIPYKETNKLLHKPVDTWVCLHRSKK